MDSASVCSGFDHFDFDTSFCSLKSTDMMEHGDLADQLSMVQQMVVEMKTGFSRAMEELSKIQYGDQTLQQQLADNTRQCNTEITTLKATVHDLKSEVEKLTGRLEEVFETQRGLQEKLDAYQSDKSMLLEELERSGAISEQTRLRLSGGPDNNNTIPHDVAPMVHPYLNSLQNHHRGLEEYNSDSSLTAAVSRSLNLTQALGEKCLNLDLSMTSTDDDEDNSRHSRSRSGSGHRRIKHRKPVYFESPVRASQKIPPHEQMLGGVARGEAARDIVDVEREYCSQLWSLMEDFMNPLRDETIVGRREFNLLFPAYIPHIYEQHCIILRKMEERIKKWKNGGVIGDVFAQFTESQDGEGLMLYKDFINDFPTIINTMNKWFTHSPHFRELMQSQYLANSPVLQLLLAPLQQVPKYSILLKSLLKYTPVDHPDRYYLESSLGRLKQFLNSMNDDLEQAMQAIDINNTSVNRTRETGNSARSKSSASSGEVNQKSRDSGVHSNEEEHAKSPLSPNTTRRHLLQVLKEKRELREQRAHERQDGQPSTPRSQKASYGSHPDLHHQFIATPEGRISPYLSSLPQSRMFSSLSKLPLPRENSHGHKSRSRKQLENQSPVINPHYLRPLTPQAFPNSGTHNFENNRRREEFAEIMRQRPQSAMECSYGLQSQHDEYLAMLAHQAGLEFSPPHSTSSDRSRHDLQLSLQKLLAETGHTHDEISDHEQSMQEGQVSYHEEFLATKNKILRHKEQLAANGGFDQLQDDFGICGDEDDEDNDVDDTQNVTPMKLLPESHKPKIMVPRWRQNASPPSYNQSVTNGDRKLPSRDILDANLAASLAQSLFENNKHNSLPQDKSSSHRWPPNNNSTDGMQGKGSMKRKVQTLTMESPRKSSARQSPVPSGSTGKSAVKSLSFDVSPHRPSSLDINSEGTLNSNKKNSSGGHSKSEKDVTKRNSITKLSDVIAYTADCLEHNELKKHENLPNESESDKVDSTRKATEVQSGKLTKLDILGNTNMKVSSVDNTGSSEVHSADDHMDSDDKTSKDPNKKVNTDSVVYYFQNRDKFNQGKTDGVDSQRSPTFFGVDKMSTPVGEQKSFQSSNQRESFGSGNSKPTGRLVREDAVNGDNSSEQTDSNGGNDATDKSEVPTKERVLMAVDKLRMSFERKKQKSEERRQSQQTLSPTSPTSEVSFQKQFNDLTVTSQASEQKNSSLPFSSASAHVSENGTDSLETKPGLYKKSSQNKLKFSYDASASARQIQHKIERAASPSGRTPSPINMNSPYEQFKSQVEASNLARPKGKGTSPQRHSVEASLIPQRSGSPTHASTERDRPKSTTDFTKGNHDAHDRQNLKSAMKETKIPVLKKSSGGVLSKSSEDISKLKKKTPFKDQLKNIFGRKKKKSKLYNCNTYDPDAEYNNHVTIAPESSFQQVDDELGFYPLSRDRRATSASHILQGLQSDDEDNDPVSAV